MIHNDNGAYVGIEVNWHCGGWSVGNSQRVPMYLLFRASSQFLKENMQAIIHWAIWVARRVPTSNYVGKYDA